MVRRAPQRFARAVAIFGGEYLEIEQSIGEWNREIDQIREAKTTEFPTRTVKQAKRRVFGVLGREESVYWRAAQGDDCAPGPWGFFVIYPIGPAQIALDERFGLYAPVEILLVRRSAKTGHVLASAANPRSPNARDRGHPHP
jgi:hypothetical protein